MSGTPIDNDLILFDEDDMDDAAEGAQTAVEVEGAADAELHLAWEAPTGTNPVLDVDLEVQVDGANWVKRVGTRQFDDADAPGADEAKFHTSIPVYIPGSTEADAYAGSLHRTGVRINTTVGGTETPTFPGFVAWLAPRDSGRTPARDNL